MEKLKALLMDVLKDLESEKTKAMKDVAVQYDFLIDKIKNVLDKLEKGDKKAILDLVCYKNLAYCCGLEKDCVFRDIVLLALDIDKNEYKKLKDRIGDFFVDEQKRKLLDKFLNEAKI